MKVKLITETKGVDDLEGKSLEELVGYVARVSNPKNQDNPSVAGLLKYCARHKHWSIFQMVDIGFEIETSRAIAAQILRHRSFHFQEFSQRYSNDLLELEPCEARRQDDKNRQNSIDDLTTDTKQGFKDTQDMVWAWNLKEYNHAIDYGVAKECARMLLPLGTKTRMYMKGTLRDWIHYLTVRTDYGTQKEHRDIAKAIQDIITEKYPLIGSLISHVQKVEKAAYEYSIKQEI